MHIKGKVLAASAVLTLTGGLGLTAATSAWASSPNCAFSNGCATLHGTDANGNTVAMDAKYKKSTEIIIGYPDNAGDGATSFDGVLHYGKGAKTTAYQDTGLQVRDFDNTCNTAAGHDVTPSASTLLPSSTGAITAGGNDLSVSSSAANLVITGGGTGTLDWTASSNSGPDSLVIAENYGAGCVSLWGTDVTTSGGKVTAFAPFTLATANTGGHIHETDTGSSVDTFTDTVTGGTFSFTALPVGVSQSGGVLTADTSTAVPGTYTSVGVVYTEPGGVIDTASFTLVITGIKSTTPGAGVPYYTFVYAPNGDWTSQCVTDVNGSGALQLVACTLGKNTGQDFSIGSGTNGAPGLLNGSQNHVSNLLAAVGSAANSCLVDASTSAAGTPQSDAADELAPGGRQLRVNGSCAAGVNEWSWGS